MRGNLGADRIAVARLAQPRPVLPHAIGGVAAVLVLAFLPGWGVDALSLRLLLAIPLCIALLAVAAERFVSSDRPPTSVLIFLAGIWALVLISGAAALFHSTPLEESVFGWFGRGQGLLLTCAVACLATCGVALRGSEIPTVLMWLVCAGWACAAVSFMQLLGWETLRTSGTPGISAALGNPNFAGAYFGILVPVALGVGLDPRSGTFRHTFGVLGAGVFAAFAVLTASSQGAVIAVTTGGAMLALYVLGAARDRGLSQRAFMLVLAGLAALGTLAGAIAYIAYFQADSTVMFREAQWRLALRGIADQPLLGHGIDGVARVAGRFRTEEYLLLRPPENLTSNVHNVPLQWAFTLGLPSAVLWCLIVGLPLALGIKAIQKGTPPRSAMLISLVCASGGYAMHAMVSIDMPALAGLGALLLAMTLATVRPLTRRPLASGPTPPSGTFRISQVLILISAVSMGTAVFLNESRAHAFATHAGMTQQLSLLSDIRIPCALRSEASSVLALDPHDATLFALEEAWRADPTCPGLNAALASAALQRGKASLALEAARDFASSDPLNARAHILTAHAELLSGDPDSATWSLEQAELVAQLRPGHFRSEIRTLRKTLEHAM